MKTIGSVVTGYEDHYRRMIDRLEFLFKEIVKPKYVTLSGSSKKYKEYNSISLLGMSVVKITTPAQVLTKRETFSELKSRGGNYYVSLVRSFPMSPSGTIDFTGMTKSDMNKIIELNLKLTASYSGFIYTKHALSIMGAATNIDVNLVSAVVPPLWFTFLLASYRLMSRVSWIIYNTAYPSMNLSKGIIKNQLIS